VCEKQGLRTVIQT